MLIKINIDTIETSLLAPLAETLHLTYGTETYKQILISLGKIIDKVESTKTTWQ